MRWILLLFILPELASAEPPVPDTAKLNQEQLQKAFRLLREDFVHPGELSFLRINRFALAGILDSLGPRARLISGDGGAMARPKGAVVESFPPFAGYIRPNAFNEEERETMTRALEKFSSESIPSLLLDLRSPDNDPALSDCLRFLDHFLPEGTVAFKVQRDADSTEAFSTKSTAFSWDGGIILLIDGEVSVGAEVVAHCLRHLVSERTLVVGAPSGGNAAAYSLVPLGDALSLRFATARILLEDGTDLFQNPVIPEIHVPVFPAIKHAVFSQSLETGLRPFLEDKERPVLNEAALVAGTNPELQGSNTPSARAPQPEAPPIQDRCLQLALDFARTKGALRGQRTKPE
ncbi:MAG: S41 family peptidase [Verrucomicrobiota bacterium]